MPSAPSSGGTRPESVASVSVAPVPVASVSVAPEAILQLLLRVREMHRERTLDEREFGAAVLRILDAAPSVAKEIRAQKDEID